MLGSRQYEKLRFDQAWKLQRFFRPNVQFWSAEDGTKAIVVIPDDCLNSARVTVIDPDIQTPIDVCGGH